MEEFNIDGRTYLINPTSGTTNLTKLDGKYYWIDNDEIGWNHYYNFSELSDREAVVGEFVYMGRLRLFYRVDQVNPSTYTVTYVDSHGEDSQLYEMSKDELRVVIKTTLSDVDSSQRVSEQDIKNFCIAQREAVNYGIVPVYTKKDLEDTLVNLIELYHEKVKDGEEFGDVREWIKSETNLKGQKSTQSY